MLFIIIGAYTLQKFDVLVNRLDAELITQTNFNALTESDEFDSSKGFNIAAAYSAYDGETDPIDDLTVGEVVFNHYKWGRSPDG